MLSIPKTLGVILLICLFNGTLISQASNLKPKLVPPLGHTFEVQFADFSPDEKYIITAGDKTAKVWEAKSGKLIHDLKGHQSNVIRIQYALDDQYIITQDLSNNVKIWDAISGEFIFEIQGYFDLSLSLSDLRQFLLDFKFFRLSPDTKKVAIQSSISEVKVWDLKTQTEILELKGMTPKVWTIAFDNTGDTILLTSKDGKLAVWDLESKDKIFSKSEHSDLCKARFTPDNKKILSSSLDGSVKLWDAKTGMVETQYFGFGAGITNSSINPEQNKIYISTADSIMWAIHKDGRNFLLGSQLRLHAEFSKDDKQIATALDDEVSLWNSDDGNRLHSLKAEFFNKDQILEAGEGAYVDVIQFNEKGSKIAAKLSKYRDNQITQSAVNIWDTGTGDLLCKLQDSIYTIKSFNFSRSGNYIITISENFFIQLWDSQTGKLIHNLTGQIMPITYMEYISEDQKAYFIMTGVNGYNVWDFKNGRSLGIVDRIEEDIIEEDIIEEVIVEPTPRETIVDSIPAGSPDFVVMAIAEPLSTIREYQSKNILAFDEFSLNMQESIISIKNETKENEKYELLGHGDKVSNASFCPIREDIVSASFDGSIKIWDIATGALKLTIYPIDSMDWVVIHPSGLFDASPGAMKLMYFTVGTEIVALDQLKERYYEPGLYQKTVNKQGISRNVEGFDRISLYPEIEAKIDVNRLDITLIERSGGIGKVSISMNGKEILPDANSDREPKISVNLTEYAKFISSDSVQTVSIRSFNEGGWLKSQAVELKYTPIFGQSKGTTELIPITKKKKNTATNFFAVIVGTADYSGDKLDLKYAHKDAQYMHDAISKSAKEFFINGTTQVEWFSTDTTGTAGYASKENIKSCFDRFAEKATTGDVLLIYLSGHGVSYGNNEKEQFYYLTKDCRSGDISDPLVRKNYTISTEELTQWIGNIAALKQVLIIDACSSGQLVQDLTTTKNVPSSQLRALDRMKDRMGMFVITGSAADKFSYEASQFGQSLLTYSLLDGMSGEALRNGGFIDVSRLFQFARDQVPFHAQDIGGIQEPVLFSPLDASSFDIGKVTADMNIPLEEIKPVFIKSIFMDRDSFFDGKNLSELVNERLDALSFENDRPIIFVNVMKKNNSYQINGLYTSTGELLNVIGGFFRNEKEIGRFDVNGTLEEIPSLILEKISALLKTQSR